MNFLMFYGNFSTFKKEPGFNPLSVLKNFPLFLRSCKLVAMKCIDENFYPITLHIYINMKKWIKNLKKT